MNIALTHWYSAANRGDLAILEAQVGLLRSHLGPCTAIRVITVGQELPPKHLSIDGAIPAPWRAPGEVGYLRSLGEAFMATMVLLCPRSRLWPKRFRAAVKVCSDADYVCPKGGGYLYARRGPRAALFLLRTLWPIFLARRLGTPRLLLGHSIGPIESGMGRAALRSALKGAVVVVRDDASLDVGASLGFRWRRAPDIALALEDRPSRDRLAGDLRVGLTVRNLESPRKTDAYLEAVNREVQALAVMRNERPLHILLFAQVTGPTGVEDDTIPLQRMAEMLSPLPCEIVAVPLDMTAALDLYGSVDLVLATRMHSAVLAAVAGTPFGVVDYIGGKASGLVADLGLPSWVLGRTNDLTLPSLCRIHDEAEELRQCISSSRERAVIQLNTEVSIALGTSVDKGGVI